MSTANDSQHLTHIGDLVKQPDLSHQKSFLLRSGLGSNHKIEKHGHKHRGTKQGFILSHSCTARVGYQRSSMVMVLPCVQALFLLAFLLTMQSMCLTFISLHMVSPSFDSFSFSTLASKPKGPLLNCVIFQFNNVAPTAGIPA